MSDRRRVALWGSLGGKQGATWLPREISENQSSQRDDRSAGNRPVVCLLPERPRLGVKRTSRGHCECVWRKVSRLLFFSYRLQLVVLKPRNQRPTLTR